MKAYGILLMICVLINSVQWIRLWLSGKPRHDTYVICCMIAQFFIFLNSIYIIASAFKPSISVKNPFVSLGWLIGCSFVLALLAVSAFLVAGLINQRRDEPDELGNGNYAMDSQGYKNRTGAPNQGNGVHYTQRTEV